MTVWHALGRLLALGLGWPAKDAASVWIVSMPLIGSDRLAVGGRTEIRGTLSVIADDDLPDSDPVRRDHAA